MHSRYVSTSRPPATTFDDTNRPTTARDVTFEDGDTPTSGDNKTPPLNDAQLNNDSDIRLDSERHDGSNENHVHFC